MGDGYPDAELRQPSETPKWRSFGFSRRRGTYSAVPSTPLEAVERGEPITMLRRLPGIGEERGAAGNGANG